MEIRKDPLVNNQFYHIYSRSISKFVVFNGIEDYARIIDMLNVYRFNDFEYKYSRYNELSLNAKQSIVTNLKNTNDLLVEIVAFCVMPTHIHLILKQIKNKGISKFMAKVLNSYTRYFNVKHHRVGPLWATHFKNTLIEKDEYLIHLTRYIHLNPVSANIVKKPEEWLNSSYLEYIGEYLNGFCDFENILNFVPQKYQEFVNDRASYQKELVLIKKYLIDNYTG